MKPVPGSRCRGFFLLLVSLEGLLLWGFPLSCSPAAKEERTDQLIACPGKFVGRKRPIFSYNY